MPSDSPPMGHNGFTFETRDDLPEYVKKNFHFFKCDADALLRDILKMPLKERGLYMTAILLMYRDLEPLPADDKAASMALHIDVREYRPLKAKLLQPGLLHEKPSGRISNARWEREITDFVMKHKTYSEGAQKREASKRPKPADPPKIPPSMPGGSPPLSQGLPRGIETEILAGKVDDFSKKLNEISEAVSQLKQVGTKTEGKNKELRKEEEKNEEKNQGQPAANTPVAVRATGLGSLAGQETLSDSIIADVEVWMHGGDRRAAEQWVSTTAKTFGNEVLRNAYQKLKTDLASGATIGRKLPALSNICLRMQSEAARRPATPAIDVKRETELRRLRAIAGDRP